MSNFDHKALSNAPVRKIAHKAVSLLKKYPFWVLVIGSLGIHAAFAVIAPSPLKKETSKEIPVVTLPVVKLPNKLQVNINPPKPDKSFLDSLFVKSSPNKLNSLNLNNGLPSALSDSPLRSLDFNNLDKLDDLPPVITGLPTDFPPLLSNIKDFSPPQFVQPQIRNPLQQVLRLDNSNPKNSNSSNLRPEFQGGLRNDLNTPPPDNRLARNTSSEPKTPPRNNPPIFKSSQSPQNSQPSPNTSPPPSPPSSPSPSTPSPTAVTPSSTDRSGLSLLDFLATDKRIRNLRDRNLLKETLLAPEDALISNPELYREKGVAWIPPKVTNVKGKTGTIIYYWIVSPYGEIQLAGYANGNKDLVDLDSELVNIVLDTVKDYKFQPIDNPQNGIYRLVTAKYVFPYRY
ncbi:hypothetical protein H6F42_17655 [Pseudanabaena sp. FACHB-1998]|uniref:hypothetical protein n=1 Tax=Pseudanabaena sp. FACHB-1998 TaxID=2692858 RepID=UPI001680C394|nr:hypothetical protein [Pseudanabaena sp. FACHB-1998]MBD2178748.1 hypothetical protein [Pseudanabaena sp. FACHB-1998]